MSPPPSPRTPPRPEAAEALPALAPASALPPGAQPPQQPARPPMERVPGAWWRPLGPLLALGVCGVEWLRLLSAWTVTHAVPLPDGTHLAETTTFWPVVGFFGLFSLVPLLGALLATAMRRRTSLRVAARLLWVSGVGRLAGSAALWLTVSRDPGQRGDAGLLLLTGAALALAGFCLEPRAREP